MGPRRRHRAPVARSGRASTTSTPTPPDESDLAGSREGHLVELFEEAGLGDIGPGARSVTLHFATFDDWWEPFTLGVGPAGGYVAGLDAAGRDAVRAACARHLPPAPFDYTATAWAARGPTLTRRELHGGSDSSKTRSRRSAFQRDSAYSSATSECTVIPPPVPSR